MIICFMLSVDKAKLFFKTEKTTVTLNFKTVVVEPQVETETNITNL